MIIFQDEKIKEIHNLMEMDDEGIDVKFKQLFDYIQHGKTKCLSRINMFCVFDVYQKLIIHLGKLRVKAIHQVSWGHSNERLC